MEDSQSRSETNDVKNEDDGVKKKKKEKSSEKLLKETSKRNTFDRGTFVVVSS